MAKKTYRVEFLTPGLDVSPEVHQLFLEQATSRKHDFYILQYDYKVVKPMDVLNSFPEMRTPCLVLIFGALASDVESRFEPLKREVARIGQFNVADMTRSHLSASASGIYTFSTTVEKHNFFFADVKFFPPSFLSPVNPALILYSYFIDRGLFNRLEPSAGSPLGKAAAVYMGASAVNRMIERVEQEVHDTRRNIEEVTAMLLARNQELVEQIVKLEIARKTPPMSVDIDRIATHPLVQSAKVMMARCNTRYNAGPDGILITTIPLCINMPAGPLPFGQYEILFNMSDGTMKIYPVNLPSDDGRVFHPHISSEGVPCWGGFAPTMVTAIAKQDIPNVLDLLSVWFGQYNPGSRYHSVEAICSRMGLFITETEWYDEPPRQAPVQEEPEDIEVADSEVDVEGPQEIQII